MSLALGSVLGAYRIIRPLGAGGMGRVYEAEHIGLRARRALKVFTTDSEHGDFLRKRFVAEGRMLADLQHPHIVRVYDFAIDETTGAPYFAMDLIVSPDGEPRTLEDACRNGADEEQVVRWFRDICEGLDYIHSKGVIHRDISLDNILIDKDGRAVLTDFGIAKIVGEEYRRKIDITVTMAAPIGEAIRMGKGLYMSPELKNGGEATPASDAYALGVLLFRLLSGSWYTSDTRLEDALAGLEYNWAEVISALCGARVSQGSETGGLQMIAARLRRVVRQPKRSSRWVWLVCLIAGILVTAVSAFLLIGRGHHDSTALPTTQDSRASSTSKPESQLRSQIFRVIDVTNYVPQTVYQIIPVTNVIQVQTQAVKRQVRHLNRPHRRQDLAE